jgi:hypothetical protein
VEPVTDGKDYQIYVWVGKDLVTVLVCGIRLIALGDRLSETGVGIRDRLQANIACFLDRGQMGVLCDGPAANHSYAKLIHGVKLVLAWLVRSIDFGCDADPQIVQRILTSKSFRKSLAI